MEQWIFHNPIAESWGNKPKIYDHCPTLHEITLYVSGCGYGATFTIEYVSLTEFRLMNCYKEKIATIKKV